MKRGIGAILAIAVLCASMPLCVSAAERYRYSDVRRSDWYYDAVMEMSDRGLATGNPDGAFRPESPVTCGEFITMAVKAVIGRELPAAENQEHWAYPYFREGLKRKLFTTDDIHSGMLDRPIWRDCMALICSNILGKEGDLSEERAALLRQTVRDVTEETRYAEEIIRSYGAGILSGYGDGTFRPNDELQRCEASSVILRLVEESKRNPLRAEQLREMAEQIKNEDRVRTTPGVRQDNSTIEERVANLLQNGAQPVVFHPGIDEMKDQNGRTVMKIDKAGEYLELALSTLKFYRQGEKYYMTITLPEVPEGYQMFASADLWYLGKLQRFPWMAKTGAGDPEIEIPRTGTITREITGLHNLDDVLNAGIFLAVVKKDDTYIGSYDVGYTLHWNHDREMWLSLDRGETVGETLVRDSSYNTKRHFTWE